MSDPKIEKSHPKIPFSQRLEQLIDLPSEFCFKHSLGERKYNLFEKLMTDFRRNYSLRIPLDVQPRLKRMEFESSLETILAENPQLATEIEEIMLGKLRKIETTNYFAVVKKDLSRLLSALAYCNNSSDAATQILRTRKRFDEQGKGEVYQKVLFGYLHQGGDLERLEMIEKFVEMDQVTKGTDKSTSSKLSSMQAMSYYQIQRRIHDEVNGGTMVERYPTNGYSDYASLLELIDTFKPEGKKQFKDVTSFLESVLGRYHWVVNQQPKNQEKMMCEDIAGVVRELFLEFLPGDYRCLKKIHQYVRPLLADKDYKIGTEDEVLQIARTNLQKVRGIFKPALDVVVQGRKFHNGRREDVDAIVFETLAETPQSYPGIREAMRAISDLGPAGAAGKYNFISMIEGIRQQYEELGEENFSERDNVRSLIRRKFKPGIARILLQASYEGHLHLLPNKELLTLIRHSINRNIEELFPAVSLQNLFAGSVLNQVSLAAAFGTEKIIQFDQALLDYSTGTKFGTKVRAVENVEKVRRSYHEINYLRLREMFYDSAEPSENLDFLMTNGYLMDYMKLHGPFEFTGSNFVDSLQTFIDTAGELRRMMHSDDDESVKAHFENWLEDLGKCESLPRMVRQVTASNLQDTYAVSSFRANLQDSRIFYQKIASAFGRTNYMVNQVEGLSNSISLPSPSPHNIYLPEFISLFNDAKQNESLYRMVLYLQAAFSRFGYFDYGDTFEESEEHLTSFFSSFEAPEYAYRIFSLLNYARSRDGLASHHPALAEMIENSFKDVKAVAEEAIPNRRTVEWKCREGWWMLDAMEQQLLFGKQHKRKFLKDMQKELSAKMGNLAELSNRQVLEKVKEIYLYMDYKFEIPKPEKHQFHLTIAGGDEKQKVLPEQTGASYQNSEVFFYEEMGGKRRARLIGRVADSMQNDRVQKIKEKKQRELASITRLFESLRPMRVHIERKYTTENLTRTYTWMRYVN